MLQCFPILNLWSVHWNIFWSQFEYYSKILKRLSLPCLVCVATEQPILPRRRHIYAYRYLLYYAHSSVTDIQLQTCSAFLPCIQTSYEYFGAILLSETFQLPTFLFTYSEYFMTFRVQSYLNSVECFINQIRPFEHACSVSHRYNVEKEKWRKNGILIRNIFEFLIIIVEILFILKIPNFFKSNIFRMIVEALGFRCLWIIFELFHFRKIKPPDNFDVFFLFNKNGTN